MEEYKLKDFEITEHHRRTYKGNSGQRTFIYCTVKNKYTNKEIRNIWIPINKEEQIKALNGYKWEAKE